MGMSRFTAFESYKRNSDLGHLNRFIYLLAFISFCLPFFLQNGIYQAHRDELLYLAEGHHLDWGYLEIPPLLSLLAWISVHLGTSIYWFKFWPAVFSGLTFILCGKMVTFQGGRYLAILFSWIPFVLGVYLRVFFLFQPNFLEIFCWTSMAYCLFNYLQTEKNDYLYYFGISLGLGLLSKSTAALYFFSLIIGLIFSRERRIFWNKHFYFSLILAFLIFLPNLLWEILHHFPFIHHMKELKEEQLQYLSTGDFLKNQVLMNLSCFYIWILGLIFLSIDPKGKPYQPFLIGYFALLVSMILLKGKDYYMLGSYPILFVFGSVFLTKITLERFKWVPLVLLGISIVLGSFFIPLIIPLWRPQKLAEYYKKAGLEQTGFLKWEDQKFHPLPQDFSDMLGWKELAEKVATVYQQLSPEEKSKTLIFCDDYCSAGAMTYYSPSMKFPEPISDASNFKLWIPDSIRFQNLILIRREGPKLRDDINNCFEQISLKDSLNTPYARELGMKILYLKGVHPDFVKYVQKKWNKEKSIFQP